MAELDTLRADIRRTLGISERTLQRRIQAKENKFLLPRRLAVLAVANDAGVAIRRFASPEDLAQLRASKGGVASEAVALPQPPVAASPRPRAAAPSKKPARRRSASRANKVFIVHGRDGKIRRSMATLLRSMGLKPIEWNRAIAGTGVASPTISEILDSAFNQAMAIVVLLTPDDVAMLRPQFHKHDDPPYESRLVGQARPNVLFEAGMAFGRFPTQTLLVQVGDVKPFSDIGGRHVLRMDGSTAARNEFATKLENAGCAVDRYGSDWLTDGDFTIEEHEDDAT